MNDGIAASANSRRGLRFADLADGSITKLPDADPPIVVVRRGDAVHALAGECPHAGAPLEGGAVCGDRLVCPWHKAVFALGDGAVLEPPALGGLARYPARVVDGVVVVDRQAVAPPAPARAGADGLAVIIGSGAAGTAAACALREAGHGGRIVLVGREAAQPYDRTALSKFALAGDMQPADVPGLLDEDGWRAHGIERVADTVTRVDAAARRIEFADRPALPYDTALLATGGIARRPDIPGINLRGVATLRDRADAAAILAAAPAAARVVIMGSGFIGMEAASALRAHGASVTVVSPETVPFARQVGEAVGTAILRLHQSHGVAFLGGRSVTAIEGDNSVHRVVLDDGERLAADAVVVGMGIEPATACVSGVAKAEDGGIIVDASMRAAEGLFVAGDCACFPLVGAMVRIEHWRVAQQQARVAALGMAGRRAAYDGVPFFWTYHFGQRIEVLGHATRWDAVHVDGDAGAMEFIAFLCVGDAVAGIVACQREQATARLIERMRAKLTLAEARAIAAGV